jgi:hypothetical protein
MRKGHHFILALVLFYCISCDKGVTSMRGAYQMISQTINDGEKDSSIQASQFKIYTDSHVMFAGIGSDSSDYFGIGTYSIEKGKVNETIFFTAGNGSSDDKPSSFVLDVQKTDKGYKQVIHEIQTDNGKFSSTEEYQNSGMAVTSPLDGTWKETKLTVIEKGDTTTVNSMVQYKIYEAGNFMFGGTYTDSTGTKSTRVGYGTFNMVSDNNLKEAIKVSTYTGIVGMTLDVAIEMIDPTHFRQTLVVNGNSSIEDYEKVTIK